MSTINEKNKTVQFEVPNQESLNSIITATLANTTSVESLIKSAATTIANIAKDKNVQNLSSNAKIFKKLIKPIKNFTDVSSILINTFCSNLPDSKGLNELLGYIEYTETNSTVEKTVNEKKSKYTVIEGITQISTIITSIAKSFESLSKLKMGWKDMLRFKKNLKFLKRNLADVFFTFLNVFKNISNTDGMSNVLTILTGTPEETVRDIKKDILDNSTNDKKEFIDKTEDYTITKGKSQGIMDVMLKTFDLLKLMFEMHVPNGILFYIKLKKLGNRLKGLWNILLDFTKGINPMWFDQLALIITGKAEQVIKKPDGTEIKNPKQEGLMSILNKIQMLFEIIKETKTNSKKLKKFRKALLNLKKLISTINLVFNSNDVIDIVNDKFIKRLDKLSTEVFDKLNEIFITLLRTALISIPFALLGWSIHIGLWGIHMIIMSLIKLNESLENFDIKNITDNISSLNDVIKSLKDIMLTLTIMIPLAITGFIGCIFVLAFTLVLVGFIWILNKLSKLLEEIAESTTDNIKKILLMLGALMLVSASILILALVAPIIVEAITGHLLPFILVLIGSILMLWLMTKIGSILSKKAAGDATKLAINVVIIAACFILAASIILVAGLVGQQMRDGDAILNIIIGLTGIITLSAIMVGLGIALSFAAPFVAMSIAGMAPLIALLGTFLLAALSIMAINALNLDFGEYIKGDDYNPKDGKLGKAKGVIGNIGLIVDFVKYLTNILDDNVVSSSNRRKMKKGTGLLNKVNKLVKKIKSVADNLNYIQNIKLNETSITDNVTKIFNFIGTLEEKINTSLYGDKDKTSNITNYQDLNDFFSLNYIKRQADRAAELNAHEKLNKVERIITTLKSVSGALVSINELNIHKISGTITKNIEDIFGFVGTLDTNIKKYMTKTEKRQVWDATLQKYVEKDVEVSNYSRKERRQMNKANEKLTKIESIITILNNVSQTITNLKNFKITDKEKESIETNITLMFGTVDSLNTVIQKQLEKSKSDIDEDDLNDFTFGLKSISESIETFSKVDTTKMEKNINNYAKFIDKVNSIEVEKVKVTADMFKQMSEFSNSIKGDFDKLAEALSEKLLPVLEDLKEVMGVLPEKIDTGFNKTSASIGAVAAPQTKENIEAQLIRENPNMSKTEIDKAVSDRLNEKANADANGLTAKLDELISLLKGGTGERVIVEVA